ncbi:hypothetical protein [Burkholderia stagnalis]|uniref:hypothetical protein n=1 Tax=Burkholderia stagnalis TaxID=1503054 RepID=UPI000F57599F|nr:hypothetical protein [Burkholderia stagnalis]
MSKTNYQYENEHGSSQRREPRSRMDDASQDESRSDVQGENSPSGTWKEAFRGIAGEWQMWRSSGNWFLAPEPKDDTVLWRAAAREVEVALRSLSTDASDNDLEELMTLVRRWRREASPLVNESGSDSRAWEILEAVQNAIGMLRLASGDSAKQDPFKVFCQIYDENTGGAENFSDGYVVNAFQLAVLGAWEACASLAAKCGVTLEEPQRGWPNWKEAGLNLLLHAFPGQQMRFPSHHSLIGLDYVPDLDHPGNQLKGTEVAPYLGKTLTNQGPPNDQRDFTHAWPSVNPLDFTLPWTPSRQTREQQAKARDRKGVADFKVRWFLAKSSEEKRRLKTEFEGQIPMAETATAETVESSSRTSDQGEVSARHGGPPMSSLHAAIQHAMKSKSDDPAPPHSGTQIQAIGQGRDSAASGTLNVVVSAFVGHTVGGTFGAVAGGVLGGIAGHHVAEARKHRRRHGKVKAKNNKHVYRVVVDFARKQFGSEDQSTPTDLAEQDQSTQLPLELQETTILDREYEPSASDLTERDSIPDSWQLQEKVFPLLRNITGNLSGSILDIDRYINNNLVNIFKSAGIPDDQIDLGFSLDVLIIPPVSEWRHNPNPDSDVNHQVLGSFTIKEVYLGDHLRVAQSQGFLPEQIRVAFPNTFPAAFRKKIMSSTLQDDAFRELEAIKSDPARKGEISSLIKAMYYGSLIKYYRDPLASNKMKAMVEKCVDGGHSPLLIRIDAIDLSNSVFVSVGTSSGSITSGVILDLFSGDWFEVTVGEIEIRIDGKKKNADFSSFLYRNVPFYDRSSLPGIMNGKRKGDNQKITKIGFSEIKSRRIKFVSEGSFEAGLVDVLLDGTRKDIDYLVNSPSERNLAVNLQFMNSLGAVLGIVLFPAMALNPAAATSFISTKLLHPIAGGGLTLTTSVLPSIGGAVSSDREEDYRSFLVAILLGVAFEGVANIVSKGGDPLIKNIIIRPFKKRLEAALGFISSFRSHPRLPNPTVRLSYRRAAKNRIDGALRKTWGRRTLGKSSGQQVLQEPFRTYRSDKAVRFLLDPEVSLSGYANPGLVRDIIYSMFRAIPESLLSSWIADSFGNYREFVMATARENVTLIPADVRNVDFSNSSSQINVTDLASVDGAPIRYRGQYLEDAMNRALINSAVTGQNASIGLEHDGDEGEIAPIIFGLNSKKSGDGAVIETDAMEFVMTTRSIREWLERNIWTDGKPVIYDAFPERSSDFLLPEPEDLPEFVISEHLLKILDHDLSRLDKPRHGRFGNITDIESQENVYWGGDLRGVGILRASTSGDSIILNNFSLLGSDVVARTTGKIMLHDGGENHHLIEQVESSVNWPLGDHKALKNTTLANLGASFVEGDVGHLALTKKSPKIWGNLGKFNIPIIFSIKKSSLPDGGRLIYRTIMRRDVHCIYVDKALVKDIGGYVNVLNPGDFIDVKSYN